MNTLLDILLVVKTVGIVFIAMGITMITISQIFRESDKTKNKNVRIVGTSNCFSGSVLIIGSVFIHTLIVMGNPSITSDYEDGFCILIAFIGILYYVRTVRLTVIYKEDEENK